MPRGGRGSQPRNLPSSHVLCRIAPSVPPACPNSEPRAGGQREQLHWPRSCQEGFIPGSSRGREREQKLGARLRNSRYIHYLKGSTEKEVEQVSMDKTRKQGVDFLWNSDDLVCWKLVGFFGILAASLKFLIISASVHSAITKLEENRN